MTSLEKFPIKVNGLVKRFGRKRALDGVTFSVPQGSVAGFLGPNGAGKTTTLRLLLGLASSDSGTIELMGHPMPARRVQALETIGAMVEHPTFIESFSGYENLKWFGSLFQPVSEQRIIEVLKKVGLLESAYRNFGVYSTGMKQRLGLAAAILHRPKLLVLDEPTNGMDPQGRFQMREILKEIHAADDTTTIFLSSHLIDEVQRLCDYVVIIDQGKTVREGQVSELLNREQEAWEIRIPEKELDGAIAMLKELPTVIHVALGPRGIEVTLKPGVSSEVNKNLIDRGFSVSAMIPKEPSLEDTFLAVTKTDGT